MLNAVLSAIPSHFIILACILCPRKGIDLVDKFRRAFLWQIKNEMAAVHCLVAWEHSSRVADSAKWKYLVQLMPLVQQSTKYNGIPCYKWLAYWYLRGSIPHYSRVADSATWKYLSSSCL